ncbi:conserved hypothetical protein [Virus Rctr71]|nr:conserved hypothetical protein [Virus Rctr71]
MTTYAYKILPDTDAESPREWDNLGHMLCKHGRYNLGDADAEQELYSILDANYGRLNKEEKEFMDYERNDDVYAVNMFLKYNLGILLPLYLFDHSGLAMSTTSGQFRAQDSMGWDWGLVGFIFVSWAEVRKEWSVKSISKRIKTLATKPRSRKSDLDITSSVTEQFNH